MTVTALNQLSAASATLLWNASWQGGLALLLVLAVSRAVRTIPPRVQCWLWRLGFLKLLIAGIAIVPVELRWLAPVKTTPAEMTPVAAAERRSPAADAVREEVPGRLAAAATPSGIPDSRAAAPPDAVSGLSRWSWLLIAWIAGVVACLVNLVRQWVLVRKRVSALPCVMDAGMRQRVAENCGRMRITRQPELRVSNDSGSPCLIGVVRSVIVLPTAVLESCSSEALNAAVLHELAHIKRRDLLWNWLPALAEAVFFFHPLVWLARREWRLAQEIATDELALSVSRADAAHYAGWLVELVAKCRPTTIRPHLAVGVSETYSQLSRRMTAMFTFQKLTRGHRVAAAVAMLAIAVIGIVPWKLTAREAQAQPESAAAPALASARARTPEQAEEAEVAAVAEIERLGGKIQRDEKSPGRPVISVSFLKESKAADADLKVLQDLPNLLELTLYFSDLSDAGLEHLKRLTSLKALFLGKARITDQGLAHLKGLTELEILEVHNPQITDEGLVHLKGMNNLVMLILGDTRVSDRGMVYLKGFTKLHTLFINGTRITDAGLEQVGGMTSLYDLRLHDTSISDAGLPHLNGLTNLHVLVLNSTKVTGAGLVQLYGLTNLQTLLLSDTRITDEAVQKLQTVLPDCKIQLSRSQARSEVPTGTSDRKAPAGPARPGKAVDELIEEFAAAEHAWQQGEVARKLVALGDKKIVPRMEKYLDTADRRRRCNAALVLAGLGDKRGVTTIIAELQDKQPRATDRKKSDGTPDVEGQIREDRYYAALLLGQLGKKEAVPALVEATTDRSINYQAAISLGEIGDRSAIPALQRMARDFPAERLWAGYALAALGESEGFDILTEAALAGPQWTDRRHAVEALGKIGNPRTVRTLTKALKDEHVNVRVSAAIALGKIGDPAALPALTEALNDTATTEVNAPTTPADEARKAIDAIKGKKSEAKRDD